MDEDDDQSSKSSATVNLDDENTTYDPKEKAKGKNVNWHPSIINEIIDKTTTTIQTAHDLLESMCNRSANRSGESGLRSQQLLQDSYKPYMAMKIASSPDKISPADEISKDLKIIVEREKSQARDAIAHEINQV
jgi:hypothetical protein